MSKICSNCSQLARPDQWQCQSCADKAKARSNKRIADGYCIQPSCYNIPGRGKSRCESCTKRRSEYDKRIRRQRDTDGICNECGRPHEETTKLCVRCKAIARKKSNRRNFGGNRELVVERDTGTCQVCFNDGNMVHHVDGSGKGGSRSVSENNSPANLILLCKRCHADIHRLGNKDTRQKSAALVSHEQTKETKTRGRALLTGWKKLRLQIKERDGNGCTLCGEEDKKIVVHHIDGRGLFCETPNNSTRNLVTLCQSCHNAITNLQSNGSTRTSSHLILALGPGTTGTPVYVPVTVSEGVHIIP